MRTITPTFTEEEAYLLHSIIIKNKAEVLKFFSEYQLHTAGFNGEDYAQKLAAIEEKLLAFADENA